MCLRYPLDFLAIFVYFDGKTAIVSHNLASTEKLEQELLSDGHH